MDDTKFSMVLVLAILGGLVFLLAAAVALIGCFCKPDTYMVSIVHTPVECTHKMQAALVETLVEQDPASSK